MLDKYKEAYDEIKVPKELITKTSLLMKEEQEKQAEKKKVGFFRRPVIFSLATGLAVVMLAVGILSQGESDDVIQSGLQAGKTIEKVELKNGELNFSSHAISDNDLAINLESYITKVGSKEDIDAFYGEYIEFQVPKGFKHTEETVELLTKENELVNVRVINEYTKKDTKLRIVYEKKDDVTLKTNSIIGKQKLELHYNILNEEYTAKYKKEGKVYSIKTEHMEQEDFITFLLNVVK